MIVFHVLLHYVFFKRRKCPFLRVTTQLNFVPMHTLRVYVEKRGMATLFINTNTRCLHVLCATEN